MKSSLKIIVACGGTGGHLFPGLAVAQELHLRGHQTLLLVSPKQIDATALESVPEQKTQALPGIGWPGFSPRLFRFFLDLRKSWIACEKIYDEYQPQAVLGMGGFTSAVPLALAHRRRLPTLIHESNAIPGRVTRLLAPWVSKTLLGFEACAEKLPRARCVVTGTPVRIDLRGVDRVWAAEKFGLDPTHPIILVMGGSQGAHGLNQLVLKLLPLLAKNDLPWQFVHLTGAADAHIAELNYRRQKVTAVVRAFSPEMDLFYSMADVAISRSGAASLTELSHYGIPSLLVPYPQAADNHQFFNAQIFSRVGAARILPEAETTPDLLLAHLSAIFKDPEVKRTMANAAQSLAGTQAVHCVADEIEALC